MARKESRVIRQQKIAAGVFAVVVAAIAGYLFWTTLEEGSLDEFAAGEHYELLENPRRIRGDSIEVMEFFSYACVHCYNFDPILNEWVQEKGDTIKFVPMPSVAGEYWRLLGRNFLTYEALGVTPDYHMPFFRAVHDARQIFDSEERLASFFEQLGGNRQQYEAAFNSPEVASKLNQADAMARRMRVASVPAIVVQGKYLVRTSRSVGPKRMLDVMDYLVEKELAERGSGTTDSD